MVGFLLGSFSILAKAAMVSSEIDLLVPLEELLTWILLMLEAGGRAEGWIWILDDSDLGSEGGVGARNG